MKRSLREHEVAYANEAAFGYEVCLRHIKEHFASCFAKQNASWRQSRRFMRARASASFNLAPPPLLCYNTTQGGDLVKTLKQMHLDKIEKNYKEHRGSLIKKYRNVFGKYVLVIDEKGEKSKVYVGKCIYEDTKVGSKLNVREINHKLINIRPGICKNTDE